MTMPNPNDPNGLQAALARRLGLVLPTGRSPFDPLQFANSPRIYSDTDNNADQLYQQAQSQRQYAENSALFNKPSNANRKRSQNLKNADTSQAVIY